MSNGQHLRTLASRFSTAAASYDTHATVQKKVATKLLERLPETLHPQNILEVGCGSGQLTEQLLTAFPNTPLDAVDVAPRMIEMAKARIDKGPNWHVGDILSFHGEPYDFIVSSSSLHWVKPLELGLEHLANLLNPGGHFTFSMMVRGTLFELHEIREDIAPAKRPVALLPEAEQVHEILSHLPLHIESTKQQRIIQRYDSGKSLLKALHDQGLTGGHVSRGCLPLSRTELSDLTDRYDDTFPLPEGGVGATYEILFVNAVRL